MTQCEQCGERRPCCMRKAETRATPEGWFCHRCLGTPDKDCDECVDYFGKPVPLTRQERLQRLADSGCDTWEEYEGRR